MDVMSVDLFVRAIVHWFECSFDDVADRRHPPNLALAGAPPGKPNAML